ncbi:MAG: (Fe-S)-binding protein [Deltaproteobacteria bacterium]|nr:(Fe-S)-binding protein [Deltaproteobacteria bacterium]
MEKLNTLKDEILKCVKCGTCRSVCPTFRVIGRETASARGKLTLIDAYLKGEIGLTEEYQRHIKECTLCGACRDTCPKGVNTVKLYNSARADLIEKLGVPVTASIVFKNLLESGRLMDMALKIATRLQGLIFKDASVESGLLSRFSLPVIGKGRLLPPLARTFFLDLPEVKGLSGPARTKQVKVAFYAGCGINYLMPEVGKASIDILKKAGVDIIVPGSQVCCGMPAFASGDAAIARSMALKNLEVFEAIDCDYIATSCATCGHGLKHMFVDLLSDSPDLKRRVEAFSAKVKDITELLVKVLGFKAEIIEAGVKKTVTYHDPCHLNRAQGIRNEPRELLKGNKNIAFREMSFPCSCCGLGGGLSIANYDLSIEITKRKIEAVRDSGAEIVATACPGCMVQLRDGLHKYGVKARVAHVVELI